MSEEIKDVNKKIDEAELKSMQVKIPLSVLVDMNLPQPN
jgi:hypothetical protein